MTPEPAVGNQILAATADECTLVAVIGTATFKLAPAFKQATQAARLAGSALIVVDMAECRSMDSTFMGAVATQGFALRNSDTTRSVLINVGPNTAALFKGLGVDRILKTYSADELPPGMGDLKALVQNLQPVDIPEPSRRDLAALMYDAHETLGRVDPENLQRFRDVLAFLRRDMRGL